MNLMLSLLLKKRRALFLMSDSYLQFGISKIDTSQKIFLLQPLCLSGLMALKKKPDELIGFIHKKNFKNEDASVASKHQLKLN